MKKPPRDPDVADAAPTDSVLTAYDEEHIITYLRLLDADAEGADWREVARAHGEVFGEIRPANTLVQVAGLIEGRLVEIEADAVIVST